MASHRPSLRGAMPSLLLALVLVSGSAAPAIARDTRTSPGGVMGGSAFRTSPPMPRLDTRRDGSAARAEDHAAELHAEVRPPTPDLPVARPVAVAKPSATPATTRSTAHPRASYHGRNHVWMPSLGIDRSISFFSCSSQAYPGNVVYRWGCAGSNNIYLFGHASSVFAPVHDAYVSGRLKKGMAVYFADGAGVVHRYTVRWWKVTTPDKGAWAYAPQPTPSLTLQTCVGARSQYRLIVRLVRSD